ncbi:CD59 glycoprotein [Lagopus muta]|uniref:CD59 glycoprotein n=1 Tax=Lagopus muta TaxID=64668 RepID=UPI00209E4B17|nr:CD59 glycoprotein [Lagopus muta]
MNTECDLCNSSSGTARTKVGSLEHHSTSCAGAVPQPGRAVPCPRLRPRGGQRQNRSALHRRPPADGAGLNGGAVRSRQGRSMIKMNCVLLTACIVLLAFSSSGYALRCYHCENSPSLCKTNSTCLSNEDTCLQMRFGKLRTSSCWKLSQCNVNDIAVFYQLDNFDYFCCQQDLCNEGAITGVNKAAFSIASAIAMLWMLL